MSEDGSEIESQESQPQKEQQTKQNVSDLNLAASSAVVGSKRVQPSGLQESPGLLRNTGIVQVHRKVQTKLYGTGSHSQSIHSRVHPRSRGGRRLPQNAPSRRRTGTTRPLPNGRTSPQPVQKGKTRPYDERVHEKKKNGKNQVVHSIENAEKNPKEIIGWINDVAEIQKNKQAPTVSYTKSMPDIDNLMQVIKLQNSKIFKL